MFIGLASQKEKRKPIAAQSEIGNLAGLQLKLQFVSNQCNKLRIRRFSLGIGNCVPEEPLEGIQISTIPGDFYGVTDGPFHTAGGGLECFRHLRVQYLCNGIHGLVSPLEGLPEVGNLEGIL